MPTRPTILADSAVGTRAVPWSLERWQSLSKSTQVTWLLAQCWLHHPRRQSIGSTRGMTPKGEEEGLLPSPLYPWTLCPKTPEWPEQTPLSPSSCGCGACLPAPSLAWASRRTAGPGTGWKITGTGTHRGQQRPHNSSPMGSHSSQRTLPLPRGIVWKLSTERVRNWPQSLRFQDPGFLRCPQWPLVVPDTRRHHRPHPFLRQVNDLPLARVSNLCKMRNPPHPLLTADQSGSPRVPWSQGSCLPCSLPRLWAHSALGPVQTLWRPEALV